MSAHTVVEIRSLINQRSMSSRQWILMVLCSVIVFADGMDVALMGFVAPPIISDWGITRAAFGAVMGAAPIGLAIGAVLAGSSSDWFGRRRVLMGSVLSFGILTLLTSFASNTAEMAALRLLTGLGLGAAMPNATTLLSEYVPERQRSWGANAVIAAFYFMGGGLLVVLGLGGIQSLQLAVIIALVGFFMSGAQTGLNAYAPGCYPTLARATGVSWMLGVGRLGSILGSSIGGVLLGLGWGFEGIFPALAIPAAIAAVAILINRVAMHGHIN